MRLLQTLLGDVSLAEFRTRYLGRAPLAAPDRARPFAGLCDWPALDGMLASDPDDVLVVAGGQLLNTPAPRSIAELRAYFAVGTGIAVRQAERWCSNVASIADSLASDVPGDQRVIVFATAENSHGFGWHYDAEDVFIVQTCGDKTYYLRRNSIDPRPLRGAQPDFGTFRLETTPIMECRLLAGDWLYVPRGYWHMARAHADSLSVSVGVFTS
jgi:50S ribosomal protein L16 3-hydroxylase